jgi:hypothetical protein
VSNAVTTKVAIKWVVLMLRVREVPGFTSWPSYPDTFRGFLESLEEYPRMLLQSKSRPSTSFPFHYSLTVLKYDATQSELLTASLNTPVGSK